jgi:hypothetical protein
MPRKACLPDNTDRDFSANPSNNKIDTNIDENLFTSLVVGYSELIDNSRVRFRIGEIIKPGDEPSGRARRRW